MVSRLEGDEEKKVEFVVLAVRLEQRIAACAPMRCTVAEKVRRTSQLAAGTSRNGACSASTLTACRWAGTSLILANRKQTTLIENNFDK